MTDPLLAEGNAEAEPSPLSPNTIVLVGAAIFSAIPATLFSENAPIGYDGWWHIFIARAESWQIFWSEITVNPHPPLYHLALKASSLLGYNELAYRSVSIVAAAVSVFLVGKIIERTTQSRALPIIAALSFGGSITVIVMAAEVRSYMLAGTFFLWALWHYTAIVSRSGGVTRDKFLFAVALCFGVLTHYSILFTIPLFALVPVVISLINFGAKTPSLRHRLLGIRVVLLCLLPASCIAMGALLFHIKGFQGPMNYMPQFYLGADENVMTFLWQGVLREWDLLAPFPISPAQFWLQLACVALVPLAVVATLLSARRLDKPENVTLPLLFIGMLVEFAGAALLGRYPFGGTLRHQYIPFILALLTTFLILGRCLSHLKRRWLQQGAVACIAALIVFGTATRWTEFRIPRPDLFFDSLSYFESEFSPYETVYVDQFSLILLFSHEHKKEWTDYGTIEGIPIQLLHVQGSSDSYLVLRDTSLWQAHLDDPKVQDSVSKSLKTLPQRSTDFLNLVQDSSNNQIPSSEFEGQYTQRVVRLLRDRQLTLEKIVFEPRAVLAHLRENSEGEQPFSQPQRISRQTSTNSIEAIPNPILVCDNASLSMTRIVWDFPSRWVEIRIGAADGKKFVSAESTGSAFTGRWVTDGMEFFAVDPSLASESSERKILGSVKVRLTNEGCWEE